MMSRAAATTVSAHPPVVRLGWILLCAFTVGCGESHGRAGAAGDVAETHVLRVAAAANLKPVFDRLQKPFQDQHPHVDLQVTYGSSGRFYAQLSQQAPYDLFFSADAAYPDRLIQQGSADRASRFVYAAGRLAVWVRHDSPLDVQRLGIHVVADPSVQRIAIAHPRHAPYGRAAEAALDHFGVRREVEGRLVMAENVAQAAQYVQSRAADVGIIALSLAKAPPMQAAGRHRAVPAEAHPAIEQVAVAMVRSQQRSAADALAAFVAGPQGQRMLAEFGYAVPGE